MAARAGFEPSTLQTKGDKPTNEPPRPKIFIFIRLYLFAYIGIYLLKPFYISSLVFILTYSNSHSDDMWIVCCRNKQRLIDVTLHNKFSYVMFFVCLWFVFCVFVFLCVCVLCIDLCFACLCHSMVDDKGYTHLFIHCKLYLKYVTYLCYVFMMFYIFGTQSIRLEVLN